MRGRVLVGWPSSFPPRGAHFSRLNFRAKQDSTEDPSSCKNSYNNPAYYILEGVPNQSAALASELLPGSALPPVATKGGSAASKSKPPSGSAAQQRRQTAGRPARPASEEGSSEDDGNPGTHGATLNRPPPDFPPPPLPKGAVEMTENPFYATSKEVKTRGIYPDLAEVKIPAKPLDSPGAPPPASGGAGGVARAGGGVGGAGRAFCLEPPPALNPAPFRRAGGGSGLDDQSCSVLQMARTLSEVEYQPGRDRNPPVPHKGMGAPHLRGLGLQDACRTFPPRSIQESIAEDLPEEVRRPVTASPRCSIAKNKKTKSK